MFEIGDVININTDADPVVMEITGIKVFPERVLYQMKPVPPTVDFPFPSAAYFENELIRFNARKFNVNG